MVVVMMMMTCETDSSSMLRDAMPFAPALVAEYAQVLNNEQCRNTWIGWKRR